MAETRYRFAAIDGNRSVRLLILNPGKHNEPIGVSLAIAPLDALPSFEAVSYTWGDSRDCESLKCDGTSLWVTRNLADILRRLRHAQDVRTLWADAVCIDQENLEERAQQVTIMHKIYETAQGVIVWLGHDEDDAAMFMDFLQEVADFHLRLHGLAREPSGDDPRYEQRFYKTMENLSSYIPIEDAHPSLYKAVTAFYQRPWFKRVWVIQEVTRNSEALAVCGWYQMGWQAIVFGTSILIEYCQHLIYRNKPSRMPLPTSSSTDVASILSSKAWLDAQRFTNIMKSSRRFLATDARDKIYALIGCSNSTVIRNFAIDYTISAQEVYRRLGPYLYNERKSLDPLYDCCQFSGGFGTLPSWVPDYRAYTIHNAEQWSRPPKQWFENSNQGFSFDGDELIVQGCPTLTITAVSEPLTTAKEEKYLINDAALTQAIKAWVECSDAENRLQLLQNLVAVLCLGKQIAKLVDDRRLSIRDHEGVYARFLLAYLAYWTGRHDHVPGFQALMSAPYAAHQPPPPPTSDVTDLPDGLAYYPTDAEALAVYDVHNAFSEEDLQVFGSSLLGNITDRRLFQTTDGLVGISVGVPQPRDEVVLIADLKVPFVLRPVESSGSLRYRCVRQCFEWDIMNGRLPGGLVMEELEAREIVIF